MLQATYAREDEKAAKHLNSELERRGIQVLSMDRLVSPGESRISELQKAIEKADLLFILVSPQSARNPWIATETAFAVSRAQEGRTQLGTVTRVALPDLDPAPAETVAEVSSASG